MLFLVPSCRSDCYNLHVYSVLAASTAVLVCLRSWSVEARTAGGCPNNQDSWTLNPQFAVTVSEPASLVGVLRLALPSTELERLQQEQEHFSTAAQQAR